MPVKNITTEIGHSLAPEGPHTITFHFPGWNAIEAFRAGDPKVFGLLRSIYPRFSPFFEARELTNAIHTALSLPPTHGCLPFVDPHAFPLAQEFGLSSHRKAEHRLSPPDLLFKVVDINHIRLYVVAYPLTKTPGIIPIWQNPGFGISTRLSEDLLKHLDTLTVIDFSATGADDVSLSQLPEPTYLPEGEAHALLRQQIVSLLKRAPSDGKDIPVSPDDVFLVPTGMAAIYHAYRAAVQARPGAVVALGAIFHSTWHLFEEAPHGFKHFGPCNADSGVVEKVAAYAEAEKQAGREISFIFLEFPSNPILVSVDLIRLREVATKYSTPLIIDDTISSFANLSLLPVSDILVSSLTKSFSGYANVMAGSIVFNPLSPFYSSSSSPSPSPPSPSTPSIHTTFLSNHHNTFSSFDASTLLSNASDYLPRTAILNHNALALATYAHSLIPEGIVTKVHYPPLTDTISNYTTFLSAATPELPEPGYGCLLSVDFKDIDTAKAFYEAVHFHKGPHLGAHETLAINFNEAVWGDNPELAEYQASFGLVKEQVRISVGLEKAEDLVDTVRAALQEIKNK